MKTDAVKVTFTHRVTKNDLINALEHILDVHGCPNCGLNGWDGIFLLGDPDPTFSKIREGLFSDKINTVINVERFQSPAIQTPGQAAQFNQR